MSNPFDDQEALFFALVNGATQYSLWPAFLAVPPGWTVCFGPSPRTETLAHIESVWIDLRPVAVGGAAGVCA
jgi:MbtH protein